MPKFAAPFGAPKDDELELDEERRKFYHLLGFTSFYWMSWDVFGRYLGGREGFEPTHKICRLKQIRNHNK
jgi:hypothetical protein